MSRRERDARDSHGKRLHSRFDRELSPKKLKRDEKPEVNATHSRHRRRSVTEAPRHEQKQQSARDDALPEAPPVSSTPVFQNEKISLERKIDKPPVGTQHTSDNREVPRSRSFYQHDDRSSTGQGGLNLSRRPTDQRRWNDKAREELNDQPKKDDRPQTRADEKSSVWRHDRFHAMESALPPARKRPAFSEKKMQSKPEIDATASGMDKAKLLSARDPREFAAQKREEKGGFHPRMADRSLEKLDRRERRVDGVYGRAEPQRGMDGDQSRERYGGMRGRNDRFGVRSNEREPNRAGGFEAEKWKHDLFDEANKSPPPKNEDEQIAKVEALLAL
ncbi:hypothetical protein KSP39_PZI012151 [Platanthera zijinensis]|uniref:Btz domain-containing protein n=1 Tax=Platanthera zijinensis TaxID=2320716 RepID=A0AAP0BFB7_9ASPA